MPVSAVRRDYADDRSLVVLDDRGCVTDTAAMVAAELSFEADLRVALDYSQFSLATGPVDADLETDLLASAQAADGVAQRGGLVVVLSPHQNNFRMRLRLEVWTSEPVSDLDEWQEAFEFHLEVGADGLTYASPTLDVVALPAPPGSYHALLTGRGFVGHGWPGSTEPGDQWRLRLWPSAGPGQARRLRAYIEDVPPVPPASHLDSGRAAALRITDDLRRAPGARPIDDQTAAVRVHRTFPVTRRRLFRYAADLSLWTSGASSRSDIRPGGGYRISNNHVERDHFDGLPTGGEPVATPTMYQFLQLRATYTEVESPARVTAELQWIEITDDLTRRARVEPSVEWPGLADVIRVPVRTERSILDRPTHYTATLVHSRDEDGQHQTTITIEHTHLPAAWAEDMTEVWNCKLEAGSRMYRLGA